MVKYKKLSIKPQKPACRAKKRPVAQQPHWRAIQADRHEQPGERGRDDGYERELISRMIDSVVG